MLKENTEINLKKADKVTRTVVLNTADKILEGQVQLDNVEDYRPILRPMVKHTSLRVLILVSELYQQNHIDDMTKKWLCLCHQIRLAYQYSTRSLKYTNQLRLVDL